MFLCGNGWTLGELFPYLQNGSMSYPEETFKKARELSLHQLNMFGKLIQDRTSGYNPFEGSLYPSSIHNYRFALANSKD
jgi:hypothetical protein